MATASCVHCSSRASPRAACALRSRASPAPTRAPAAVLWIDGLPIRNLASPAHPQDIRAREPFSHGARDPEFSRSPAPRRFSRTSGTVPRSHEWSWVIAVHRGEPSEHIVSRFRPVPTEVMGWRPSRPAWFHRRGSVRRRGMHLVFPPCPNCREFAGLASLLPRCGATFATTVLGIRLFHSVCLTRLGTSSPPKTA